MKRSRISVFTGMFILVLSLTSCVNNPHFQDLINDSLSGGCDNPIQFRSLVTAEQLDIINDFEPVIVLDVRTEEEYLSGHIPGSINIPIVIPISAWTVLTDLLLELPEVEDLENLLGSNGISNNSKVIVVSGNSEAPIPPYELANATRVVATLNYIGLNNARILDGGLNAWTNYGGNLVTEETTLEATTFTANVDSDLFVSTAYVEEAIGVAVIIDTRDSAVYVGEVIEPWASKAGHIPTAVSLPAVLFWNADNTYKSIQELKALAQSVLIGVSKQEEIIIYCGVGGYTSTGYFVLNNLLGYKNVKFYDGSAQAWVIDNDMVY